MMNNQETNIISQTLGTAHFWSAGFATDINVRNDWLVPYSLIRRCAEITFPNLICITEEHLNFRGGFLEENNLDFFALLHSHYCLISL